VLALAAGQAAGLALPALAAAVVQEGEAQLLQHAQKLSARPRA
jgi:hypothetical protein